MFYLPVIFFSISSNFLCIYIFDEQRIIAIVRTRRKTRHTYIFTERGHKNLLKPSNIFLSFFLWRAGNFII